MSTGLSVREQPEAHLIYYYIHTHYPIRPFVKKLLLIAARIEDTEFRDVNYRQKRYVSSFSSGVYSSE